MAVRTVRVVLTGTVTPYTNAMRTAARTTTATARTITATMRQTSVRVQASMTAMARGAQAQAARAGMALRTMAARAGADMTRLAARTAAATRAALAPVPALAARAGAAFTRLGQRGTAAMTAVRAASARAAAVIGTAMPAAAVRAGNAVVRAGVRAGAAAGTVASRWSTAAAALSARWSATWASVSAGGAAVRAGAGAAAGWVAARWSAAAGAVSARWSAASAAVTGAMTGARTAAGAAAGAVAARWTAAATAVGRAFSAMRLAAFAAGAGMLAAATGGRKALEAARTASLGLVAAFGLAAFAAARFEKGMSEVRAVTGGSAADMKALSNAALEAGQATIYSATQAANAEAELARAGISTADIVGGALKGSLDLAASGQLELGESAIISAQAMNAFKLAGGDVGHIADVISAGAGKSATNVHDMGQAFRQAALLSSQTGLSLEQTVGTLAMFAQNALTGSDAGTSLKVMLQRLVPQSKEAAAMMDKIGFSAYDAQGNFIGLSALAANMKSSFAGLTPEARNAAMATIFGSDAVRAATILYEAGASGVDSWVKAVDDSGYATRVAATMTDNLAGDVERLAGALETALITSGTSANSMLRDMARWLTNVVNWYSQLPPGVQSSVTAMTGLIGVGGLLGTAMLLLLPRIMTVRRELVALGVTSARTRAAMGGLARIGGVVAVLAAVTYGVSELKKAMRDAPPSTDKLANSLLDFGKKGKASGEIAKAFGKDLGQFGEAVKQIAHPGLQDRLNHITESVKLLDDADLGFGEKTMELAEARDLIGSLDQALAQLVQSGAQDQAAAAFDRFAVEAEKGGTSAEKLLTLLPGYTDALAATDTQGKLAAGSQGELGNELAMTAEEMADQKTAAEELADSLKILNGTSIGAAEGEISFRSSLADLTGAVKDNGRSLDVTTEKGRAVKGAFLDAAKAAMAHAEAVSEQSGTVEAGQAVLEQDIAILKRTMDQAGFTDKQIRELTDAYAQLPGTAETAVTSPGARKAAADLAELRERVMAVPPGKTITVKAPTGAVVKALEDAGYSVKKIPGTKNIRITAPTGTAIANAQALARALNGLRDKNVTITSHYVNLTENRVINTGQGGRGPNARANGGIIRRYAAGGDVVQSWPVGGPIYGPGTGTSDSIPALVSNGEYVVKAAAVRKYGVAMFDRLNAMRYASGGGVGFTYTPTGQPVLGGPGDAKARYDKEVQDLKDAWAELTKALADQKKKADALRKAEADLAKVRKSKPTAKQLDAAKDKVTNARTAKRTADATVNRERSDVFAADAALGVARGAKAPTGFNLAAYQKQLGASVAATEKWRASLAKIGRRGGAEVQALLEAMGEEGYALVNALAGASDKQFKDITSKLLKTGEVAKASLADFTKQLGAATQSSGQFASDLQALAARGFGDLAQALAAQGDQAAMDLARQAVTGGAAGAAQANAAVKNSAKTLTGEDLANSLVLLTTLRSKPGAGYAELLAAGLDTGVIRALVPRMMAQINALPSANKSKFLSQYAGQGGATAMARGGILTRPTTVLAAEAGDTEAWIPINSSGRSRALLARTASAMGYRLTPASRYGAAPAGGRQVVREGDRISTVNLYGAKQSSAEQAMDVARHMQLIG
ncbi:phage tail tape measure protein [Streptomyces sp. GMY02]|uniref:phage tail tape measure protein n=1 Tax=Streptomyces sp. GMY02 TaxID=1333528 RepID=UPI001C2B86D6|nr:phage tail tape measure protein [Streptomyces sp. GMY02]QXE36213.1 phage tail tape measure protein [Streptomyces sp. GMY02]